MSHVHTQSGEIDLVVDVAIVYHDAVKGWQILFRLHEKSGHWLFPGGHVELNETALEGELREAKEETGLDVELYGRDFPNGNIVFFATDQVNDNGSRPVLLPVAMDIHPDSPGHRHWRFVYYGLAKHNIINPAVSEKLTECRWLTRMEVENGSIETFPIMKGYALAALDFFEKHHE